MRTLSVIIPMYNESDVLPLFVDRLRPVLDRLDISYEVVAVDDGSTDNTATQLQRIRRTWEQLRVVRLRANAGHQAALSAGLAVSRGDWMVSLDADLQDPPEVIPDMLAAAFEQQADVVYAVRNDRTTDSAFKRNTARMFYRLMGALNKHAGPADAGDFRLMSRATVDAVLGLPEHNRVLRLVVPELGFPSATVAYRREERAAGSSKYPLSKMLRLSLDAITGASIAPLRLATWLGLMGFVASLGLVAYALIAWGSGRVVSGWTSTLAAVAGVGAVQLLCLGIVGEYLGRLYVQHQKRPTYYIAYDSSAARPQPSGVAGSSGVVDVDELTTTGSHRAVAPQDGLATSEAAYTPHNSGDSAGQVDLRTAPGGRRARRQLLKDSAGNTSTRPMTDGGPSANSETPSKTETASKSDSRTDHPDGHRQKSAGAQSPASLDASSAAEFAGLDGSEPARQVRGSSEGAHVVDTGSIPVVVQAERRAEVLDIAGVERHHRRVDMTLDVSVGVGGTPDPTKISLPEIAPTTTTTSASGSQDILSRPLPPLGDLEQLELEQRRSEPPHPSSEPKPTLVDSGVSKEKPQSRLSQSAQTPNGSASAAPTPSEPTPSEPTPSEPQRSGSTASNSAQSGSVTSPYFFA